MGARALCRMLAQEQRRCCFGQRLAQGSPRAHSHSPTHARLRLTPHAARPFCPPPQAAMLPLLVNSQRIVPEGSQLMRAMIEMTPIDGGLQGTPGPDARGGGGAPPAAAAAATAVGVGAAAEAGAALGQGQLPQRALASEGAGGAGSFLVSSAAAAAANFRANLLREVRGSAGMKCPKCRHLLISRD